MSNKSIVVTPDPVAGIRNVNAFSAPTGPTGLFKQYDVIDAADAGPTGTFETVYVANVDGDAEPDQNFETVILNNFIPPQPRLMALVGFNSTTSASWAQFYNESYEIVTSPDPIASTVFGCIDFTNDGTRCAISGTTSVYIFDLTTGVPVLEETLAGVIATNATTVAFNPDGSRLLIVNAGTVLVYDTSDWSTVTAPTAANALCGDWSPDGAHIAIGCGASPYVRLFRTSDMAAITNPASQPSNNAITVRFSPAGNYLAVAVTGPAMFVYDRNNSYAKLSNPSTVPSGTPGGRRSSIAWAEDDSKLGFATNGAPRLWVYSQIGNNLVKDADVDTPPNGNCSAIVWGVGDEKVLCGAASAPKLVKYDVATWTQDPQLPDLPNAQQIIVAGGSSFD